MKTIVQINAVANGSTGKIMRSLQEAEIQNGYRSIAVFARNDVVPEHEYIKFGSKWGIYAHVALTRLLDRHGLGSKRDTVQLVKKLESIKPDIVHLHNIHGYYINYEILFDYLKRTQVPVIWTLHDCWAFTGHCAHFEHIGCKKYATGCFGCVQKKEYPQSSLFDASKFNYKRKNQVFGSLENLHIVTPSKWLAELVNASFLRKYPSIVINNGIDTSLFRPSLYAGVRDRYGIPKDRFFLLAVASVWNEHKGLPVMIRLALCFHDCTVVIVGLTDKQIAALPSNAIGLKRTEDISDLVSIYNAADVFVNPSRIECLPTVNIEAQACGTPVVCFDVGGTSETLVSGSKLVPYGDFNALCDAIKQIRDNKPYKVNSSVAVERFSMENMNGAYLEQIALLIRGNDET